MSTDDATPGSPSVTQPGHTAADVVVTKVPPPPVVAGEAGPTTSATVGSEPGVSPTVGPSAAVVQEDRLLFSPAIDIFENEHGLVLVADLPGVSLDRLELQVQDNRLTLFGQVAPVVSAGVRPLHQEYREGDFLRSFILHDEIDHERISARLSNGVLEIQLPRAAPHPPRKIQVQIDS